MHSPSALTEHVSPNLAGIFLLDPVVWFELSCHVADINTIPLFFLVEHTIRAWVLQYILHNMRDSGSAWILQGGPSASGKIYVDIKFKVPSVAWVSGKNLQLNATSNLVSTYSFPEADGPPCNIPRDQYSAFHMKFSHQARRKSLALRTYENG